MDEITEENISAYQTVLLISGEIKDYHQQITEHK